MSYKIGDTIVYPRHGIAEVKRIDTREVNGVKKDFYILKTQESMTIMLPFENADNLLRPLVDREHAEHMLDLEYSIKPKNETWAKRYREFSEMISAGGFEDILGVYRALTTLSKELSFGERKMIQYAESLLVEELKIVLSKPESEILTRLRGAKQ